jgi:hypothetical protein
VGKACPTQDCCAEQAPICIKGRRTNNTGREVQKYQRDEKGRWIALHHGTAQGDTCNTAQGGAEARNQKRVPSYDTSDKSKCQNTAEATLSASIGARVALHLEAGGGPPEEAARGGGGHV